MNTWILTKIQWRECHYFYFIAKETEVERWNLLPKVTQRASEEVDLELAFSCLHFTTLIKQWFFYHRARSGLNEPLEERFLEQAVVNISQILAASAVYPRRPTRSRMATYSSILPEAWQAQAEEMGWGGGRYWCGNWKSRVISLYVINKTKWNLIKQESCKIRKDLKEKTLRS